jgi:hypothetical protein
MKEGKKKTPPNDTTHKTEMSYHMKNQYIPKLKRQADDAAFSRACVVDYLGFTGHNRTTGQATLITRSSDDVDRYGVRSSCHAKVYNFRVIYQAGA